MDLIDRNEAIRILEEIRDKRAKSCSRQAIIEAAAMNYAIEIVRKIPTANEDPD